MFVSKMLATNQLRLQRVMRVKYVQHSLLENGRLAINCAEKANRHDRSSVIARMKMEESPFWTTKNARMRNRLKNKIVLIIRVKVLNMSSPAGVE